MSPVTHLLVGWVVANTASLNRRERTAVTVAGAASDLDGFGVIAEVFTRGSANPLPWFSDYHHVLGHNLAFGLLVAGASALVATRRWKTAGLALVAFHIHLLGDLVGARGPDGYQWPIPYLLPFSNTWQWTWDGQWALNAWPNILITLAALGVTFVLAWQRGYSPLGMVSRSLDSHFIDALRHRFPRPPTAAI